MIIYNVTSNVANNIHDKWMAWMMEDHIPKIMETGKFNKIKIVKVLGDHHHPDTTTYSVQYTADSREKLDEYYKEHSPRLRAESQGMFGDSVLQFRTELEIVQEFKMI